MSLIPSTDCFATGDPASAFFLRNGQPIATPSPLQVVSASGAGVLSVSVANNGAVVLNATGSAASVSIPESVSTFALSATSVVSNTIDADIVTSRILFLTSTAGVASITLAVPGMTVSGAIFAQQVSSGAVVTPVVAECLAGSIVLTAAAPMAANVSYFVYVASLL